MNHSTIARTLARGIRLSVVAALLALLSGLLTVTQPGAANGYVVTNHSNAGLGSLRQAIINANNNPGDDIITFAIATNVNPIVLAGASGEDANVSGDLDILDNDDLTIQGNGAANTIIDGGGIDRVFHVCPGGGCTGTVTLSGVTIRNGSVTGGGGGILNYGTLNVQSSTIGGVGAGNTATNGGGIYNLAMLNVQNGSTVSANTAKYGGGGILNYAGTTTVDGSTVSTNTANNGGGIYNRDTLKVQNGSTIGGAGAGNQATDYGGGIYNGAGTTTVDGSSVSANKAGFFGGGIYNAAGTTTVDGSTVSDNTAWEGGGIFNIATLNVQNGSTVSANTATWGGGGGIYNANGTTTVDGSTINANTAGHGGGINNANGTTTVDGSTVSDNTAWEGGGIFNIATLNVQNGSTVSANTTNYNGGGIYNWFGMTTVDGSTVSANTANFGGGIFNIATLNVQNGSTIGGAGAGNQATNDGGGILNYINGTTTVTGSRILNNTAVNGGGVYNDWDVAWATSVTDSCIVRNSAKSFFNNQNAKQIATGNWWGAANGPNNPGADTVGGNVHYTGWLTEPILGCGFYVYLPLVLK